MKIYNGFAEEVLPFLVERIIEHNDLARHLLTKRPIWQGTEKKKHDKDFKAWLGDIVAKSNMVALEYGKDEVHPEGFGFIRFDSERAFTELRWEKGYDAFKKVIVSFLKEHFHLNPETLVRIVNETVLANQIKIVIDSETGQLSIYPPNGLYGVTVYEKGYKGRMK